MNINELLAIARQALKELVQHKVAATLAAIVAAFIIFFIGVSLPKSYVTSAVIHADNKSLIEPLLQGRSNVKAPSPVNVLVETLYSPTILDRTAIKLGLVDESSSGSHIENTRKRLQQQLFHEVKGDKIVRLSFTSNSADYSFQALNTLIAVFLENSTAEKTQESAEAYEFISRQVDEYKKQLAEAESRLSNYKIQNMDGTESEAFKRISELRSEITSLELRISENQAKTRTLKTQITKEGSLQQARAQQTELLGQLRTAQNNLRLLQLSFQDDYPDIVSTKSQISQLTSDLEELRQANPNLPADNSSEELNLFDEMRSTLSSLELETESLMRRKQSFETLLKQESERADKAAVDQAMLAELTRDYDKTQQIYEQMLQQRENAKLALTIDQQGQGMSYRIAERPVFPLTAQGPPAILIVTAAPIIAALMPLGLCLVYVFFDPRIRYGLHSKSKLPEGIDIIVNVPTYHREQTSLVQSKSNWALALIALTAIVLYAYFASFWLMAE